MTPEETQREGIASLIAMLELMMFACKSGYYHRLLMVYCIVLWSLDSLLAFLMRRAPQSVAKGTASLTLHTREAGADPLHLHSRRGTPIVVVLGLKLV